MALSHLAGCGVYSFTGTTITAETLSIQPFYNDSDLGPANLAVTFTDQLRDYFQQNTSLSQIDEDGELQMEGSVLGYTLRPIAATTSSDRTVGDAAQLTRLTVTVKVAFTNTTDDQWDFDRNFSFFSDFDSSTDISQVEAQLLDEIFEQIILDVFNASVANW